MPTSNSLPPQVEQSINTFVDAAKAAFGSDLVSIIMYGSAAAGRLRAKTGNWSLAKLHRR